MSTITPARPKTFASTRRLGITLGLVSALTGGTLVAQAPQAEAATTKAVVTELKPQPNVTIQINRRTIVKGQIRAVIRASATSSGEAVQGKARLLVNGNIVGAKNLDDGRVVFRPLGSKFRVGENRVRVVALPGPDTGLRSKSSATRLVRMRLAGSPVVRVAHQYIGTRYVFGGSSPRGFDCSGFTSYVYRKAIGKVLPRSSSAQSRVGYRVSRSNARPGDLVWTPGHVAIYAGNGVVIEASRPGVGVVKRKMWQDNPRFIRVSKAAIGA